MAEIKQKLEYLCQVGFVTLTHAYLCVCVCVCVCVT